LRHEHRGAHVPGATGAGYARPSSQPSEFRDSCGPRPAASGRPARSRRWCGGRGAAVGGRRRGPWRMGLMSRGAQGDQGSVKGWPGIC